MNTQFKATVIKDSMNPDGDRITTFELEYPRFIHAEILTHRLFSRNSASSRAIPVEKMIAQVCDNPAMPIHWGKNQKGMQAKEELTDCERDSAAGLWRLGALRAANLAQRMTGMGGHKQWVNRVLEPYQLMKVVLTSTDFNNFLWLRNHADAQPEIKHLARLMQSEFNASKPDELEYGMWHLPYVRTYVEHGLQYYLDEGGVGLSLTKAVKISCSSCAQVSYRKLDTSLEKAEDLYARLVESEPVHASAFEHVAKCEKYSPMLSNSLGWTHSDFAGNYYSGNFRNWMQYRQLIPDNSKAYSK